ncbi:MAG: ribosome recycling factor [Oscillospiraceae bacterium]|nr:ribosome recycling factor [Oscillospiraceae bacterium]
MNEYVTPYNDKMSKTVTYLKADLAATRAGRANPAVLDKLTVDYYGTPTAVNQMAAVSVSEARVLVIQPWDASTIKSIEKAIQTSDIGINPMNDGRVIRLTFPQLTEERRRDLVKEIKKMAEDSKVAVRSIRRDAVDKFKALQKSGEVTEDDLKQLETEIQKATDAHIKGIDDTVKAKETEIMEI